MSNTAEPGVDDVSSGQPIAGLLTQSDAAILHRMESRLASTGAGGGLEQKPTPAYSGEDDDDDDLSGSPSVPFAPPPSDPAPPVPTRSEEEERYDHCRQAAFEQDYSTLERLHFLHLAGRDDSGRPVAVLYAARLDLEQVDLKQLLLYIIAVLDPVVNEDYSFVFVGTDAHSSNRPPLEWLKAAYSMLNRKYKKNLKALYIVHSSFMLRASLNVLLRLVSTKFWKKISFVDDVSELWPRVPPAQLALPNYVLAHNFKAFPLPPVFGASSLTQVLEIEHRPPHALPRLLEDATAYLREGDRLRQEGLFRQCGEDALMKKLTVQYNMGLHVNLQRIENPHTVAVLLKRFLGSLQSPLIPVEYFDIMMEYFRLFGTSENTTDIWVAKTAKLLPQFPRANRVALGHLLNFLDDMLQYQASNLMDAKNLGTVFGPNLLFKPETNGTDIGALLHANSAVELIIRHRDQFIPLLNNSSLDLDPPVQ